MDVTLAWDPNPEPDIAGYRLYWGASTGSYDAELEFALAQIDPEAPQVTVNDIPTRLTYFVVTAYNTAGLESLPSNEVVADPFDPVTDMNLTFSDVHLLTDEIYERMGYTLSWDSVEGADFYEVWAGGAAIRTIDRGATHVDLVVPRNTFRDKHATYYIKAFAEDGTLITISEEASILTHDLEPVTEVRISYE